MGRKKVDWTQIEQSYITTTTTLDKLAEEFGLDPSTVYTHSAEGQWVKKRREFKAELKKGIQKGLKTIIIDKEKELNARHYKVWEKILKILEEVLDDKEKQLLTAEGKVSIVKLGQVSTILTQVQGGQRLSEGLIEASKLREIEQSDRRIDMEEIKTFVGNVMPDDLPTNTSFVEALKDNIENIWKEAQESGNQTIQE